jgi:hypothetical protein
MDGRGCWRDNVFLERLWRSVKQEEVYLKAHDSVSAARAGIARYFDFYNARRPHQAHDGRTPDVVYFDGLPAVKQAAWAWNTGCPPRRSCVRRRRRPPAAVDNPEPQHFDPQPIHLPHPGMVFKAAEPPLQWQAGRPRSHGVMLSFGLASIGGAGERSPGLASLLPCSRCSVQMRQSRQRSCTNPPPTRRT